MGGRILIVAAAAVATLVMAGCESGGIKRADVSEGKATDEQRTSYMLGRDIGRTLHEMDAGLDMNVLFSAIKEVLDGDSSQLTNEEMAEIDKQFRQDLQARREAKAAKLAEDNKAAGEAFLAENRQKPDVVVTESGLQYTVLTEGTGETPKETDRVSVHYTGTLLDGTEFDSSHKRGSPAVFGVNGVIRGWSEALQLMKVGGKMKVFVPSDLAYGPRGMHPAIQPNSTLIFEIELLSIEK